MSERNLTLLLLLLQVMGGAVTFSILTSCLTLLCQKSWSTALWFTASRVSSSGWPLLNQDCFPAQASFHPSFSSRLWPQHLVPLVTTDILGLSCPLKTTARTLPMAFLNLPLSFSILLCSLLRQNIVVFMQLSTTLTLKELLGLGIEPWLGVGIQVQRWLDIWL